MSQECFACKFSPNYTLGENLQTKHSAILEDVNTSNWIKRAKVKSLFLHVITEPPIVTMFIVIMSGHEEASVVIRIMLIQP